LSLKKRIEKLEKEISDIQKKHSSLLHKFVPALFFCGWLPNQTQEQIEMKKSVQSCYPYCCFNHLVGLPTIKYTDKFGTQVGESQGTPLWDYERDMIKFIEESYYYGQNKCRGAGASEIITVRYMLYKYATTSIQDRKCLLVAGTNIDAACVLMHRIKQLADKIPFIYRFGIPKSDFPTEFYFKCGMILALAANPHVVRSYENVGHVILEESAFWKLLDDTPVLTAAEPHVIKSSAHIVVLSTPNGQRGFFWNKIFNPEVDTKYTKHVLNWREVVDVPVPVVNEKEILRLKEIDPAAYDQEFDNKFLLSGYQAFGPFKEEDFEPEEFE